MAPLGDRLLIRPKAKATQTTGGVLLTSGATEQLQEAIVGTVLAVGSGVESGVAIGDDVLFLKYSSADVEVPGGDICFVAEKSVLAKLS
jgi:chaperonin GroES